MSVRLEASAEIDAPIAAVWDVLIDWTGQSRWIPLTTVRVTSDRKAGLGTRVEALSVALTRQLEALAWSDSARPIGPPDRHRLVTTRHRHGGTGGLAPWSVLHW